MARSSDIRTLFFCSFRFFSADVIFTLILSPFSSYFDVCSKVKSIAGEEVDNLVNLSVLARLWNLKLLLCAERWNVLNPKHKKKEFWAHSRLLFKTIFISAWQAKQNEKLKLDQKILLIEQTKHSEKKKLFNWAISSFALPTTSNFCFI